MRPLPNPTQNHQDSRRLHRNAPVKPMPDFPPHQPHRHPPSHPDITPNPQQNSTSPSESRRRLRHEIAILLPADRILAYQTSRPKSCPTTHRGTMTATRSFTTHDYAAPVHRRHAFVRGSHARTHALPRLHDCSGDPETTTGSASACFQTHKPGSLLCHKGPKPAPVAKFKFQGPTLNTRC